ncbi:P44/Msp2 family outer membrane protein [Candidatus Neoehrlichia procyonis]|uniref:Surface antigen family protein n=1 Tax=Candidatus Neoehrlichia procyonis str. RAC413 TaxID=1359163 RepID=A0A0F3NMX5_9RICK|nr:P44/Msp2 family outer membrane protein [Candidatus Neoehrlichia lotoris]KJV69423.1 surface antigen family protein [Candidatus Neoehrlichia lotoris str. RAC413]
MNCKGSFVKIALAIFILLFSNYASSDTLVLNSSRNNKAYIYMQYKPGIPKFRKFSIKEMLHSTSNIFGVSTSFTNQINSTNVSSVSNYKEEYRPTYDANKISFGGGIGYLVKKYLRLEFEAFYENFNLNKGNYLISGNHRYFALVHDDNKYVVMENRGLKAGSTLLNICYDVLNAELKQYYISPYFCAGIGINLINFLDSNFIKLAYQGKSGINFTVNSNIIIYFGAYYHGIADNKFINLPVIYSSDNNSVKFAESTLSVSYFGAEFGVRFMI